MKIHAFSENENQFDQVSTRARENGEKIKKKNAEYVYAFANDQINNNHNNNNNDSSTNNQYEERKKSSSNNNANTNCLFTAFIKIENIETYFFISSNG